LGEVFNIGCGSRTTVNDLARILAKIMEADIQPVHEDERPGDIRHSFADISKAGKELQYAPRVRFEEGLSRTVEWFLQRA